MNTIERVLRLHEIELFRLAATDHLGELAAVCQELTLDAGEILFEVDEPSTHLNILIEGKMQLANGGREGHRQVVELASLDPWAFFAQSRHSLTAQALEECKLFRISYEDLVDILTAEPDLCLALLRHLARQQSPPCPKGPAS
ncbi:MAG TPA: cyclic nucleotide-binding domain-containing protein [Acidobacteriota bacterium]|nr:cyclic nucleotide-binding domain-containing protein [Acidobacteriota bacterium]